VLGAVLPKELCLIMKEYILDGYNGDTDLDCLDYETELMAQDRHDKLELCEKGKFIRRKKRKKFYRSK
jgi:hypothetical protein